MNVGLFMAEFKTFRGEIISEKGFVNPEINLSIDTESLTTQNKGLDRKISSRPFLFKERYPQILFSSIKGCSLSSGGIWELNGNISIKHISRTVTMVINSSDIRKREDRQAASFNLFGTISLNDFEIGKNHNGSPEDMLSVNALIYLEKSSYNSSAFGHSDLRKPALVTMK